MALIFKFRASMTSLWHHNRKYGRLVTLLFIKVKGQNLVDWGYFDVHFSKNYLFLKLKASMTSL